MNKILNKYRKMPVQIRASLWFLICSMLQRGISVITTPIFTRLLTTGEYGEYNLFNSWWSIINVFVSLHLFSGIYTQGIVKFDDRKEEYSSALQGLTLTLVTIWLVIYFVFHDQFNRLLNLNMLQMVALFVMIWTSAVFNFWASAQRVNYKYQRLVILTLIVSLAKPLLGIFLVSHFEDKVTARILGLAGIELICYIGLFLSQMKNGRIFFSKSIWKYGLTLSIPLIPHYLSQTILNNSDRIMIEKMVGASSVGIYSLAYSLSMIMTLFNSALLQTLDPWIYQKIKGNKIEDIGKVAYVSLVLIGVINLLLIFMAPEIVRIFAPEEYYEAIWAIPPIAMSVYFLFAYNLFADFEFYFEKTKSLALATMIGAVLNIVLNYIFIQIFGYVAAGYTTLFCYSLYAALHYLFMRKICRENLDGRQPFDLRILIGITLVFVTFGFITLFTYNYTIVRYAFIVVIILGLAINCKRIKKMILGLKLK
ncbi:oligosaccharide flippase family protein [bacterium 210820-DFI.6.37]|nr:oligosaccharide flippase family protein [bacterium 210820-DFI.6.37]